MLRSFAVKLLARSVSKGVRRFLFAYERRCTRPYREIMWGISRRRCPPCTWGDGKGWGTGLGDGWCLRHVYDHSEPQWALPFERWTKSNYGQDTLSQKLFAANTLSRIRKQFTAVNRFSQDVAKQLFRAILRSAGEFELPFCVVYPNKRRQKSSSHLQWWRLTLLPYQDWQLEQHRAHDIWIFPCEPIRYVSHFLQSESGHWTQQNIYRANFSHCWHRYCAAKDTISTLVAVGIIFCLFWNIPLITVNLKWELDGVTHNSCADGLRKKIWNRESVKALQQVFNQADAPAQRLMLEVYKKCIIHGMLFHSQSYKFKCS